MPNRPRRRKARKITELEAHSEVQARVVSHLAAKLQTLGGGVDFDALSRVLTQARARHYLLEARLRDMRNETWTLCVCAACGGSGFTHLAPYVPCACAHSLV